MSIRRLLAAGLATTALVALAGAPAASAAAPGVAQATIAPLASASQHPFIAPKPRPSEGADRPNTEDSEPNRNAYSVPEAPASPACGAHFCVHWVAVGLDAVGPKDSDGDGIPNYVERVLGVAEHVHEVENEKLGWREPVSDGTEGGGHGKTDIYLAQIGAELFGYAAPDPHQDTRKHPMQRHLHGYLVLDNNYSAFEFPGTSQQHDLEVTLAHEYNHILQFGYDAFQDAWFAEASATWMEDQVYNEIDDYLRYIPRWVHRTDEPLTSASMKEYGDAVWNQWLAHRYGISFIRKVWAGAIHAKPGGFSVNAYEAAIHAAGKSDFSHDFTLFAADTAEWRTGEGFRESRLFEDVPRQGRLPLGGRPLTRTMNHTSFSLLRVRAHRGRAVVVHMLAPRGVEAGLALVGRIGGEKSGRAVKDVAYHSDGGQLTVRLGDPSRFSRITAVVVNADGRADGYNVRRLDWRYLTDGVPFEISGDLIP
ncbi:MAG TPA: MXAN_6640 family putative metalloprotease [Solirubrobacterales bacterium]|nr:MXAN_6640 family putative metalloprotease [Solirubrobacterales bacterium]